MTNKTLYLLKTSKYEILNKVPLDKLSKIITITTNSNLFALNFKMSKVDLLLESLRRTEFIMFLKATFDMNPDLNRVAKPLISKTYKLKLSSASMKKK